MARRLEELRVYQQAVAFSNAVTAILDRPAYRRDRDLWEQTSEANDSIPSNISEGFEQGSDPMFVKYLFYSKGSLGEVIARLRRAHIKRYISEEELAAQADAAERLSRSLGAFIRYLDSCGWQDRGRHRSRLRENARAAAKKPGTERLRADGPTTAEPTTDGPPTKGPTTEGPTTEGPTTEGPTTKGPTTEGPTTEGPTTKRPTTKRPTTKRPTTEGPTTEGPTTKGPTTKGPTTKDQGTRDRKTRDRKTRDRKTRD
jgi:four helix bundle protein